MSKKPGMTTPRRKIAGFHLNFAVDAQGNCLLDFELHDELIADLILGLFFGTSGDVRREVVRTIGQGFETGRAVVNANVKQIADAMSTEAAHDIVEFADDGNIYEVGPLAAAPGKHQA